MIQEIDPQTETETENNTTSEFTSRIFEKILPQYLGKELIQKAQNKLPLKKVGIFAGVGAAGNTEVYYDNKGVDFCVINVLDYKPSDLDDPDKMLTILEESIHYLHFAYNDNFRKLYSMPEEIRERSMFDRNEKNEISDTQLLEHLINHAAFEQDLQDFEKLTGIGPQVDYSKMDGELSFDSAKNIMTDVIDTFIDGENKEILEGIAGILGTKTYFESKYPPNETSRVLASEIEYSGKNIDKLREVWGLLLENGYKDRLITSGHKADVVSDSIDTITDPKKLIDNCIQIIDQATTGTELQSLFNIFATSPSISNKEYNAILKESGIEGLKVYVKEKLRLVSEQAQPNELAIRRMRESLKLHWRTKQRAHIARAEFGMRMLVFDLDLPYGVSEEQVREEHPKYWKDLMGQIDNEVQQAEKEGKIEKYIKQRIQSVEDININAFVKDEDYSRRMIQEKINAFRADEQKPNIDTQAISTMLNSLQDQISYQMSDAGSTLSEIEHIARRSRQQGHTNTEILENYTIYNLKNDRREMLDWLLEPIAKVFTHKIVKRLFPETKIPDIDLSNSYMYSRLLTEDNVTLQEWLDKLGNWFDSLQGENISKQDRQESLIRFFQADNYSDQRKIIQPP